MSPSLNDFYKNFFLLFNLYRELLKNFPKDGIVWKLIAEKTALEPNIDHEDLLKVEIENETNRNEPTDNSNNNEVPIIENEGKDLKIKEEKDLIGSSLKIEYPSGKIVSGFVNVTVYV